MRHQWRLGVLGLLAALAGCAGPVPGPEAVPNPPPAPRAGLVVLFNGLTWFFEDVRGTGTHALAESIRRAGVRAEIERPSGWEALAEAVLRDPALRSAPIAVYGYSWGARAAAQFATRLAEAGVPVQTLVALDAFGPVVVPCNVRSAVHFRLPYAEPGDPALAAARPGCAPVSERLLGWPGAWLTHFSASRDADALATAQAELLAGGRVRVRPPPGT